MAASATRMTSISEINRLISQLETNQDILGDDFCEEVEKAGKKFIKELSESVGKNILHNLDEDKPTKERVEAIITALPSALSVKDEDGRIPIQEACWHDSVEYVGLLAREGVKYNVGGEGKRGGLLLQDPTDNDNDNPLQLLSNIKDHDNPVESDMEYRDVLKDLWESGLLTAADITEYHLLYCSCRNTGQLRFEYLTDVCPEALKMLDDDEEIPFHTVIERPTVNDEDIQLFLRTAIKHFPNELGLLFQKDDQGRTSFEVAISEIGKDRTFSIIRQCIPQDTSLPILHHVAKHAPRQYIDDFIYHYPDAANLKDEYENNRTYIQARIASGNTTFAKDAGFFVGMSPEQIEMIDPLTDLYPFMVAASGETSDLETVFYLLKREPKLAFEAPKCRDIGENRKRASGLPKEGQGKERKRLKQS